MRLSLITDNEHYKKEASLCLTEFLLCLPAVIVGLYAAITANTVIIWADTIATLDETLHCFIIFYTARKMSKETGEYYNYGLGRLEVLASLGCELLLCVGLLSVMGSAVYGFFNPQLPTSTLGSYCLLKACNIIYDLIFLSKQYKITKTAPSAMNKTELKVHINALVNDVVVTVVVVFCFFFRESVWSLYLNPAVTIILSAAFFYQFGKHIRKSLHEISDYSLPVPTQDRLFDIVLENRSGIINKIESVNCRKLNDIVYIDVTVRFNADVTYSQQTEFLDKLTKDIREIEKKSEVHLIIGSAQNT